MRSGGNSENKFQLITNVHLLHQATNLHVNSPAEKTVLLVVLSNFDSTRPATQHI
jgi:hypothetical protein